MFENSAWSNMVQTLLYIIFLTLWPLYRNMNWIGILIVISATASSNSMCVYYLLYIDVILQQNSPLLDNLTVTFLPHLHKRSNSPVTLGFVIILCIQALFVLLHQGRLLKQAHSSLYKLSNSTTYEWLSLLIAQNRLIVGEFWVGRKSLKQIKTFY